MTNEIKRTRRDFLNYGGMILTGLAAFAIPVGGSLYIEANTPERDKKIKQIQDAINKLRQQGKIAYVPNFGHVIDLSLEGQAIRTNISREEFNRGHKLSYQPEETNLFVRVYPRNEIEVYQNSDRVYDPETIKRMQTMTDRVLEALVSQTQAR